ncbi:MAG: DUF4397 domain-containing protein, partial [Gemmataceae bacterium]
MSAFRFRPQMDRLESREVPDARLQVIHASPFPAAAVVDVYVNDERLLDNFRYTDATPYITVPSGTPLKIDIVGGDATTNKNPVFTTTVNLPAGSTTIAAAVGDPDFRPTPILENGFFKIVTGPGVETAPAGKASVQVLHAAPNVPVNLNGDVAVRVRGAGTVLDNLSFTEFAEAPLS